MHALLLCTVTPPVSATASHQVFVHCTPTRQCDDLIMEWYSVDLSELSDEVVVLMHGLQPEERAKSLMAEYKRRKEEEAAAKAAAAAAAAEEEAKTKAVFEAVKKPEEPAKVGGVGAYRHLLHSKGLHVGHWCLMSLALRSCVRIDSTGLYCY